MEQRIKALSEDLIAKIAAGEVITSPVNVIKELIENSLDAKATTIHISIKEKGTFIKVSDNGIGFDRDDLPLACVRHTTSKLRSMDDFETLENYGFRGEALSSISQVADVTIITKRKADFIGSKGTYKDGVMLECKNIAAKNGTVIRIENLFSNMSNRQEDMIKNFNREYIKVLEVIQCYAIHCNNCSFQLDKDTRADVISNVNPCRKELVKSVLGRKIANNLLELEYENVKYEYKFSGLISNTNATLNKYLFILFINNRLVDCSSLKTAIKEIFADRLMKGNNPFIYLNLSILQKNLDVNLHPSKREVRYLNEDLINKEIGDKIQQCLVDKAENQDIFKLDNSFNERVNRSFEKSFNDNTNDSLMNSSYDSSSKNQRSMQSTIFSPITASQSSRNRDFIFVQPNASTNSDQKTKKAIAAHKIIRNDATARKIDDMWAVKSMTQSNNKKTEIKLNSIHNLKQEVEKNKDVQLTYQIRQTTLVGIIDSRRLLVQHQQFMHIIDFIEFSKVFMYQNYLMNFGNFSSIAITKDIHLIDLLEIYKQQMHLPEEFNVEERVVALIERNEMFKDYFSLTITNDGFLKSIPVLIDGHRPNLNLLPYLIWNLNSVSFENEKNCFRGIGLALADFYSRPLDDLDEQKRNIQNIFSRFKEQCKPPQDLIRSIKPVADLPNLYKIFERC